MHRPGRHDPAGPARPRTDFHATRRGKPARACAPSPRSTTPRAAVPPRLKMPTRWQVLHRWGSDIRPRRR